MPETVENGRDFNYDISSLLAYPPPPLPSEVVMTISGMDGENWNGLGNGTHDLDGSENLDAITGSTGYGQHRWRLGDWGDDSLRLRNYIYLASGAFAFSILAWYFFYNGSSASASTWSAYSQTTPSIRDFCFTSTTINGVTFTWSKGTDWSRGEM